MKVTGYRKNIHYDKILVAWGADKKRLEKSFSNVHYIEDRYSHAKVHNDLLRANQVVVIGGTFDALQLAQSTRTYLDEIGRHHTKIMLINDKDSEI
jgi:thioredoxin reductase